MKPQATRNGFWAQGYGGRGSGKENEISSNYQYDAGGAVFGYDALMSPRFLLGVSAGYSRSRTTVSDHVSDSVTADSYQGSLYASWNPDPWYVNGIFSYAYNRYSTSRDIHFDNGSGTVARTANADYAGNALSASAEAGYRAKILALEVIPLVGFRASYLKREGFTESGAGALNLDVDRSEYSSLQSSLGLRVKKDFTLSPSSTLTPEVSARWLHEYSDAAYTLNASFVDYSAFGFSFDGSGHVRDSALIRAGLTLAKSNNVRFYANYDLNLSTDRVEHGVSLGVNILW